MNPKLLFETFKDKLINRPTFPGDDTIPITLVFEFLKGKVFTYHSDSILTKSTLEPSNAIDLGLTYDSDLNFDLLEQDFKEHSLGLGFPCTKRVKDNESEYFWLGYADHPDFESNINFDDTLTEKVLVDHIANSIARQFDHLHLHNYLKLNKKFKLLVLYWNESLECIYLKHKDMGDGDDESDFDVELCSCSWRWLEFTAWYKQVMATRDENDEFFNYFEVLEEQIVWEVESKLDEKLENHPLFKKKFKSGSCIHDIYEIDDLYRDLYEDEEDEDDDY